MTPQRLIPTVLALLAISCASAPKPILYPNPHLEEVGKSQSEQDIEACREKADAAGAHRDPSKVKQAAGSTVKGGVVGGAAGAAGGAVAGNVGRGAGIGAAVGATAGLVGSAFRKPPVSQAHMNFVNRCLSEDGYEPVGWQ